MAAVLDRVEGEVYVLSGPARTAAKAGQEIRNGEGIDCDGARSGAIVRFPDKTRLELAGETTIREIFDREPAKGRHLFVEKGAVKAEVTQQPQPMIFETSHGEAKVLGTILRITTDPDPKKGTRLEVEEGKVELKNAAGRTVLVDTGHMALAASGAAFTSKRLPKDEVLHAFDFEDGKRPEIAAKGAVERGPDRRLCLAGEPEAGASRLFFAGDGGLFTASGEETLSFDYWVDAQAASLNFHFWNTTRKVKNETEVEKLVSGKWTHFTVRLADLGVKEGEWIGSLFVQATGSTPRRLYVDNFVLSRPLNLKPK